MHLRMPKLSDLKPSRRTLKVVLGVVLAVLVIMGVAAWQVPRLVRNALTQNVAEMLGRPVSVGKIGFNPFGLTLHVHDLAIAQPGAEQPLLAVGELDVSAAWRSLVFFAPIVDAVRIHDPRIALVREDVTRFNFSDIQERLAAMSAGNPSEPAPEPSKGLPRFSLNNMRIDGGTVSLDDRVTGRKQVVDEFTLGIPFISTFGYATDIDVEPRLHLRINGSPFDMDGTARPFDKVPSSSLNVVFSGLELEKWADAWPLKLPVKVQRALLDSNLQVLFEQPPDAAPRVRVLGDLGLRQLDLREASGEPLAAWDGLQFSQVAIDLQARTASVGEVRLQGPRVEVHRDAQQQLNWLRVASGFGKAGGSPPAAGSAPAGSAPAAPAPAGNDAGWKLNVDAVVMDDGAVRVRDDSFKLDYPINGLAFSAENIVMPQPAGQPLRVWLNLDNSYDGSWLRARAPVTLSPLAVDAQVELGNLALAPFASVVHAFAPMVLQDGRLGLAARVKMAGSQVEARDVRVDLKSLAARDESIKPAVDLSLGSLALTADRLAPDAQPANFELRADGIQKRGTLALKGALTAIPLSMKTSVNLADLDLASLAPYVASSLNATVRSLSVAARGDADFAAAQGGAPMRAGWRGAVDVNGLDLEDRVNQADFLNWKHLGLSGMNISVAGEKLGLNLGDIALEDFYGNILLNNEGRLNVLDLVAEKGKAGGSITQDTQTRRNNAKPEADAKPGAMPDISISGVTLKRGRMTFNDHFVKPNYRAELSAVEGSLSAVSSAKPAPAKVSVTGRVYGTAPLSVSGTVQPFSKFLALDIKASAKGVDLPRFTTYSNKYVGYSIDRGKLSVDLQYKIKDRALEASNKVLLNQLTFGKPSNSPDALKLPVLLAVALLKDTRGNIDIDLPISGSLDDPQFSVGGIIMRVVMNLLVSAVTSPFRLLASAFGGGEELSYVEFPPGSAGLDDKARSSLDTLVKALTDRPGLKMDIIGRVEPQADEEGLRQAWVDDQIRAMKARETAGRGAKPDPKSVTVSAEERSKYLKEVYGDTSVKGKPRNLIGIAKDLSDAQMDELLRTAAPYNPQALRGLADARAQAVYEYLQSQSPALVDRVFMVAPKLDAEGIKDQGKPTRVDFSLQ